MHKVAARVKTELQFPAASDGACARSRIQLPVVYIIKSSLPLDQKLQIILNRFGERVPVVRDREPAVDKLMDMLGLPDPQ